MTTTASAGIATDRYLTHLRHVALAVPDLGRERDFFTSMWGLDVVEEDSGVVFLAAAGSPEQYVLRLREGSEKRLDLFSLGCRDAESVEQLALALGRAGVRLISEPGTITTPGGGYGFRFFDIDGRTVEVSADVATRVHRKIEAGESIPVRLSHFVINTEDAVRTRDFYSQHLGFALTDILAHPRAGEIMYFMRLGQQHHDIGISKGPHASANHVSFEMRGIDEFLSGTGRLVRGGVDIVWGPGRHRIGRNTFTYVQDPHGNLVEYTTELEPIDEDIWHPTIFDVTDSMTSDTWGFSSPMSEFVSEKMFNDRDQSLFQAPPI